MVKQLAAALALLLVAAVAAAQPVPPPFNTSLRLDLKTLNVRAYGANGDDANDDRAAIQTAIDLAANGAGVVVIPCGTYMLSANGSLNGSLSVEASNVAIRGAGRDCTTLKWMNGVDENAMIVLADTASADGFQLSGVTLDGNGVNWPTTASPQAHAGIQLRGNASRSANKARIEDNRFVNFNKVNTAANQGYGSATVIDWGRSNWTGLLIRNNEFGANFGKMVNVRCSTAGTACSGYRIEGNTFDAAGVSTWKSCLSGADAGEVCSVDGDCAASTCVNPFDYAIQVTAVNGSTGPTYGTVANNRCQTTCHGSCIKVMASHATIVGNLADNCSKDQIIVSQISGSHCEGGTNDAAVCTVSSECPSGTCAPIRTSNVSVTGNVAINGSDGGFGFETSSGKAGPRSCTFSGNVAAFNDVAGLYVEGQDITVSGNTFDGNGVADAAGADAGVYIGGQTSGDGIRNVHVVGNTFTDTGAAATQKYGIQIAATLVDGTVIEGNSFRNQVTANVLNSDHALVTNTTIRDVATTFANLPADTQAGAQVALGSRLWCSDCTATTTCAGSGAGAWATRLSAIWSCNGGQPTPTATSTPVPSSCPPFHAINVAGYVGAGPTPTCIPLWTPGPSPTATAHPVVLPTAACDATRVGQPASDADEIDGRQSHVCTDLLALKCVGGTNDGSSCTVAGDCPSGWCARYAWRRPATRVSNGTSPGLRAEEIAFSSNFSATGSTGKVTVAPGSTFKMDGEAIAPGEVPVNIQPTPDLPKCYGANCEATLGYVTSKRCFGGTNHGATCTADSLCPSGACYALMAEDGSGTAVPLYLPDGLILGQDLKIQDHADEVLARTASFCVDGLGTDLPNMGMAARIFNKANNRTIEKICWRTNAVANTGINLRFEGSGGQATPYPTPALPTPTTGATPNAWQADAGCLTGQSITWRKDQNVAVQWTQVTGVNQLCVMLGFKVTP